MLAVVPLPGVVAAACLTARDLAQVRVAYPSAAVLAVVPDEASEAALLAAGADEVVRAGASAALVAARAAALAARGMRLVAGPLTIDLVARTACCDGRRLALREREHALLVALARRAGRTVDHATLRREACGLGFDPGTNLLAVHVSRLRAALAPAAAIVADKGRGYRLDCGPG